MADKQESALRQGTTSTQLPSLSQTNMTTASSSPGAGKPPRNDTLYPSVAEFYRPTPRSNASQLPRPNTNSNQYPPTQLLPQPPKPPSIYIIPPSNPPLRRHSHFVSTSPQPTNSPPSRHPSAGSTRHPMAPNNLGTYASPLGDMSRTVVDGMVPSPPTSHPKKSTRSASTPHNLPSPHNLPPSKPPSHLPSILTTPYDLQMATQQTRLHALSPTALASQHAWAQSQIQKASICPQGYGWTRSSDFGGGYICEGKKHFVSNELVAQGRGGVFLWAGYPDVEQIYGPYYRDLDDAGRVRYAGPEPRDRYAPEGFEVVRDREGERNIRGTAEQLSRMCVNGNLRFESQDSERSEDSER